MSTFTEDVHLRGERVVLRPFGLDDAEAYIEIVKTGEGILPPNFPTALRAETLHWWLSKGVHQSYRYGTSVHLAVTDRDTGALTGTIGLFRVDWSQLTCEVGYAMRPAARGRGHATDALRLISFWALLGCGLHRVELRAATGNAASIRVAEKAGYRREGVARGAERGPEGNHDQLVFGLIAPDLRPGPGDMPEDGTVEGSPAATSPSPGVPGPPPDGGSGRLIAHD